MLLKISSATNLIFFDDSISEKVPTIASYNSESEESLDDSISSAITVVGKVDNEVVKVDEIVLVIVSLSRVEVSLESEL